MQKQQQRRLRRTMSAIAFTVAVIATATPDSALATGEQSDYDRGYELGLEAYKYGLPLMEVDKTHRQQTSIDITNGHGYGPDNQFNPIRHFSDPTDRWVVSPNLDTLYAIAWLDLSDGPQVISVPKVKGDRYWGLHLMDPYTESFATPGSVEGTQPGAHAVVGPDDATLPLPGNVTRIQSSYDRVLIIERIYADNNDPKDIEKVRDLQKKFTIVPLSEFPKKNWHPPVPADPDTTVDLQTLPTGLAYFDQLGDQLAAYPPPAADQAELDKLATIGVGPGMTPSTDPDLSAETLAGMTAAVANGRAAVTADTQAMHAASFPGHNGYLTLSAGTYGTDYRFRAVVAQTGLGALTADQAIYMLAFADRFGSPLTAAKRYVIHLPADWAPPAEAFWSLTLYDAAQYLVPNDADRYVINDRSDLHRNADGSVDLYVQSTRPTDPGQAQNWLPGPASGSFRLAWRLYAPTPDRIPGIVDGTGWNPPAIMPAS
ncbi:DUF1254 domain-containing protein [Nocardioides carbamazepini]|uniref:DUF1254 domain-containing protein n=1 Tax=Nocardioides carbamazepini TaxID=2854259 RepID=UPI00214A593E|nr:DUF1254 domain-containing protein [Nocardioides carbamazepini]